MQRVSFACNKIGQCTPDTCIPHTIFRRKKAQKHNNVHVEVFLGGETGTGNIIYYYV